MRRNMKLSCQHEMGASDNFRHDLSCVLPPCDPGWMFMWKSGFQCVIFSFFLSYFPFLSPALANYQCGLLMCPDFLLLSTPHCVGWNCTRLFGSDCSSQQVKFWLALSGEQGRCGKKRAGGEQLIEFYFTVRRQHHKGKKKHLRRLPSWSFVIYISGRTYCTSENSVLFKLITEIPISI